MTRVDLPLTNGDAETGTGSGWTSAANVLTTVSALTINGGANTKTFATQNVGAFDHFQDVAVPSTEYAAVDAGNRAAHVQALVGRVAANYLTTSMTFYFRALNGSGTVLQSWTRRIDFLGGIRNTAFWENLPALTRTIRVGWSGTAGAALDVNVDNVLVSLDDPKAPASFTKQATITIDHTQVGPSDIANFEMRVAGNFLQLLPDTFGGAVVSQLATFTDADHRASDVRFWADAACVTPLDYEISQLYWQNPGGVYSVNFEAWVRIPTLSHTVDTVLYMTVGNKTQVEHTENQWVSWWRPANRLVLHFGGQRAGGGFNATYQEGPGRDSSVNNQHLGANGGADATAYLSLLNSLGVDSFGSAYNSAGGSANHSNSTALTLGNPLTIKAWVKPASRANFRTILNKGTSSVRNYDVHMNSAGQIIFAYTVGSGVFVTLSTTAAIPLNTWTHIMVTYDGSAIRIYFNGVISATGAAGITPDTTTANLDIGVLAGANSWDGLIDELRIMDIIESTDRLAAEYNNQRPGQTMYSVVWAISGGSGRSYLVA